MILTMFRPNQFIPSYLFDTPLNYSRILLILPTIQYNKYYIFFFKIYRTSTNFVKLRIFCDVIRIKKQQIIPNNNLNNVLHIFLNDSQFTLFLISTFHKNII
jgi:hypothetical protein